MFILTFFLREVAYFFLQRLPYWEWLKLIKGQGYHFDSSSSKISFIFRFSHEAYLNPPVITHRSNHIKHLVIDGIVKHKTLTGTWSKSESKTVSTSNVHQEMLANKKELVSGSKWMISQNIASLWKRENNIPGICSFSTLTLM